jgi:hypothetical protein
MIELIASGDCLQLALFHHPVDGIQSPVDSLYHCCNVIKPSLALSRVTACATCSRLQSKTLMCLIKCMMKSSAMATVSCTSTRREPSSLCSIPSDTKPCLGHRDSMAATYQKPTDRYAVVFRRTVRGADEQRRSEGLDFLIELKGNA